MINFNELPITVICLLASTFCFMCTIIGASLVFFIHSSKKRFMACLLAFASGVMIASSFFSLLTPAIEACNYNNSPTFIYVAFGFMVGGGFIIFSEKCLDKLFAKEKFKKYLNMRQSIFFVGSITLKNIPEALAIGVAFGSLSLNLDSTSIMACLLLALGIGIQNIPEGASVTLPLHAVNITKKRAFFIGSLTGIVEPLFAPIACIICMYILGFMPFFLSFAAGTMMAVATCELMPEAIKGSKYYSMLFLILGFTLMSILTNIF